MSVPLQSYERAAAEFRQWQAAGIHVASLQDKVVSLSLIFGAESLKKETVRYILCHQGLMLWTGR